MHILRPQVPNMSESAKAGTATDRLATTTKRKTVSRRRIEDPPSRVPGGHVIHRIGYGYVATLAMNCMSAKIWWLIGQGEYHGWQQTLPGYEERLYHA